VTLGGVSENVGKCVCAYDGWMDEVMGQWNRVFEPMPSQTTKKNIDIEV
jgi:hypothetical protein